jgi:hypothetical protein
LLLLGSAILAAMLGAIGCGGGSSSTTSPTPSLTPQGTYTLQIVATEGATTHSLPITLVVQ